MMTVLPSAMTERTSSCSLCTAVVSRFAVGSSSTYTSGLATSTEAKTRLWRSPPLISVTLRPSSLRASRASTVVLICASISDTGIPRDSSPKASSSLDVRLKNWLFGFWNTLPTRSASSYISQRPGSSPQTETEPVISMPGSNDGIRPLMHFVMVVLPDPERPTSIRHSPLRTSRSIPSRIFLPPAASQETFSSLTTGSPSGLRGACETLSIRQHLPTRQPRPPPPLPPRGSPSPRRAWKASPCPWTGRGFQSPGTSRRERAPRPWRSLT